MNEGTLEPSPETFEAFYIASRPGVFRTALVVSRDRDRALDATDEAFARAFVCWGRLRHHPNPRAWVVRTAINYYRTWQRTWSREILEGKTLDSAADSERLLAAVPAAAAVDPDLIAAVSCLPQRQREVIALRYLADLDPEEIAELLDIASSTVAVHHHRAMKTLRTMLAERKEETNE
jgi:RNA polymerase sigma factor (sigma-70 family)